MSAFIVSDNHILALVGSLFLGPSRSNTVWTGETRIDLNKTQNVQKVVDILVKQNHDSYNDRYRRNGEAPKVLWKKPAKHYSPVQILKACFCYSYQSCETEDWESSSAKVIIENIQDNAIRCLSGYEEADWEII